MSKIGGLQTLNQQDLGGLPPNVVELPLVGLKTFEAYNLRSPKNKTLYGAGFACSCSARRYVVFMTLSRFEADDLYLGPVADGTVTYLGNLTCHF